MSTGPDDDEELLLEDLEASLEPDEAPPPRAPAPPAPPGVAPAVRDLPDLPAIPAWETATVAGLPPFEEAAAEDPRADAALYEAEAASETDGGRRAALLLEVARLAELALGDGEAALVAARASFAAAPSLAAVLGPLRRLLAARGLWEELAAAYDAVLASAPLPPDERADVLVERGRVLEDRLGRADDARSSYAVALTASPDHGPALLALLCNAARAGDAAAAETALAGLGRRAGSPARAVALAAALSRLLRASGVEGGAARALRVVRDALRARPADAPLAPLLAELDALSRTAGQPAVEARALKELAHQEGLDPAWIATLLRERARLLRDALGDPKGALEALEGAARLAPAHPLVAADLIDLAESQARFDVIERVVTRFETAAGRDAERAQALALRRVRALGRADRIAEAVAALDASPVLKRAAGQPAVFGLRVALLARARDAGGLAAAFAAEGARLGGAAGARALVFAGAVRQWWTDDAVGAEELYRRALAAAPAERAAWDASEALLASQGRWAELAALLEAALAEVVGVPEAAERELTLREELVALYRDDLNAPDRAYAHQKVLVQAAPRDVRRRVRLRDLELAGGRPSGTSAPSLPAPFGPFTPSLPPRSLRSASPLASLGLGDTSDVAEATAEEAETLKALAAAADEPAVAAALEVEAARLLGPTSPVDERRVKALELLRKAAPEDVTGLGTALYEAALVEPEARARVVARELEGAAGGPAEVVRALRFRLAHHHAASGRFAEAVAALTPLRAEADPLARIYSWDLARRSRDPILEVAVLSDETDGRGAALGAPEDVDLALGEALERAGDAERAGEAFARSLARAPSADAAVGLLRVAAATPTVGPDAMSAALAAVGAASGDQPRVAAAAGREEALLRVAAGAVDQADLAAGAPEGATPVERAETALVRWAAGVKVGDAGVVADALAELGASLAASAGAPDPAPLLARASARVRLAGAARSEALHKQLWRATHAAALATAVSDLPVPPGEGWPAERPDPRRARATKVGGSLGLALDLEAAFDAERRGALGAALSGYGRVIAAAPDHLEAWEGIRRVARAGDDALGEARALTRLAMIVHAPALAGALASQAARLFEQVGRWDEALALWGQALEVSADDTSAYERLHDLLAGDLETPGRAQALDRVLGHRLARATLEPDARVGLLFERALLRLERLDDAAGATEDFKRILKIEPHHSEALWRLGRLAGDRGDAASAAAAYERFLSAAPDDPRAAEARMDLAAAYEATHDRARAIETLRRAAALRPGDPEPLEHLVELHTRLHEWRSAVEVLRDWEARQPDPHDRAELQLRIGVLLRDAGRDPTGAALAFRRAAELDPLGEGGRALVALHDAQNDGRGAVQAIEREIAELRGALARDPLDDTRLARLEDFLTELGKRAPSPSVAAAHAAVSEVRALLRDPAGEEAPETRGAPRPLAPRAGGNFWADVAFPGSLGFRAEIWPHLVDAAVALFPPSATAAPPRARKLAAGEEPRLSWVDATAAAFGLGGLHIFLSPAVPDSDPAQIIEQPEPGLALGMAVLDPKATTRFLVGRALGMLRARAAVLDRVDPAALGPLFACAALTAGAALPAELQRPDDATERTVGKVMTRRDRKALTLQSSRFGFESVEPSRWGLAVRRTADRLGLLLAGDVAAAARAAARTDPARWKSTVRRTAQRLAQLLGDEQPQPTEGAPTSPLDEIRGSERAMDLIRFALGAVYPAMRQAAESGGEL
jgi:tetratricopeptide (TPR) repeat protein